MVVGAANIVMSCSLPIAAPRPMHCSGRFAFVVYMWYLRSVVKHCVCYARGGCKQHLLWCLQILCLCLRKHLPELTRRVLVWGIFGKPCKRCNCGFGLALLIHEALQERSYQPFTWASAKHKPADVRGCELKHCKQAVGGHQSASLFRHRRLEAVSQPARYLWAI